MLSFSPRDVLDEIWDLIESVSKGFPTYFFNHSARSRGRIRIYYRYMKVYCVISLESPHRSESNEYTHYTIFSIKKKKTLNFPNSAVMEFFQGTQERVLNSRGNQAIEILLILWNTSDNSVSFFCHKAKNHKTHNVYRGQWIC